MPVFVTDSVIVRDVAEAHHRSVQSTCVAQELSLAVTVET